MNFPMGEDAESHQLNWEAYWAIVRRRRWWFLIPLFLGWVCVFTYSWFLPAHYRSETVILVEHQKVPQHYVISNTAAGVQERLHTMTQQILSRTRLQRIIEKFELYSGEESPRLMDVLVARMRGDIDIELVRSPGGRGDVSAFKVAYSSPTPELAQEITMQLTSLFIEDNLRVRQQRTENTTDFLESQLVDARQRLREQEERLREFKVRYLGQLPEQMPGNIQMLGGFQRQLQEALAAVSRAAEQKIYLESLLNQYRYLRDAVQRKKDTSIQTPGALDEQLARLESELTVLEARYTDRHPDVRQLKNRIAETEELKKQIETELVSLANQSSSDVQSGVSAGVAEARPASLEELQAQSPIMRVESELKTIDLKIKTREEQIQKLKAAIREYDSRINVTPLREQQLADLTRDYEQSRQNYDSLLAKKLQSELASNLEKRQQGEQFVVIDPPSLPQVSYSPDRLKLSLIGLFVGFVLGFGVGAGAELIDDRVYRELDLKGLAPVTVLVAIPPLLTPREQRMRLWRSGLEVAAAVLLLAVIVAGNVFVYRWG